MDPVGVGASTFRKASVQRILDQAQVTLIKGNAAEISAMAGLDEVASRGVDSGAGKLHDPKGLVRILAKKERCLVLLSGETDYLSNGEVVVSCHNGHELLGRITGSGCALGVTVAAGMAAACAMNKDKEFHGLGSFLVACGGSDLFCGALTGYVRIPQLLTCRLLAMTIASELAGKRADVQGPGSFIPALIDELAVISPDHVKERAKITVETFE